MEEKEIKSTEKQNPIVKLGEYGVKGGPGRPRGLKNKHTQIKDDMLAVWLEEQGKERFRELFKGSKADFLKALEKIIAIMPKEIADMEEVQKPIKVIYSWRKTNGEEIQFYPKLENVTQENGTQIS